MTGKDKGKDATRQSPNYGAFPISVKVVISTIIYVVGRLLTHLCEIRYA